MITSGIDFTNFKNKKKNTKVSKILFRLLEDNSEVIKSLKKSYKSSFSSQQLNKYKYFSNFRVIGIGGSSLGTKSIYEFLKNRVKKKFSFVDNLQEQNENNKKKSVNIVVSKSGNTIETIVNSHIFIKNRDKNIFITENKNNYLYLLAQKLKSEIIHHNNYIGGRYSVLSEVGMLPVELMGLKSNDFRQLNSLIKNKKFLNSLILNVSSILNLINRKKFNSIIINYDQKSENLFKWYQQLIAESLGKKGKGIFEMEIFKKEC